jgi:hypothetical protein
MRLFDINDPEAALGFRNIRAGVRLEALSLGELIKIHICAQQPRGAASNPIEGALGFQPAWAVPQIGSVSFVKWDATVLHSTLKCSYHHRRISSSDLQIPELLRSIIVR